MMRMSFATSVMGQANENKFETCDHGKVLMNVTCWHILGNPFADFQVCLFRLVWSSYFTSSDCPYRLCKEVYTVIGQVIDGSRKFAGCNDWRLFSLRYVSDVRRYQTYRMRWRLSSNLLQWDLVQSQIAARHRQPWSCRSPARWASLRHMQWQIICSTVSHISWVILWRSWYSLH